MRSKPSWRLDLGYIIAMYIYIYMDHDQGSGQTLDGGLSLTDSYAF